MLRIRLPEGFRLQEPSGSSPVMAKTDELATAAHGAGSREASHPDPERRRLEWGRAGETVTEYFPEYRVTEAESQCRGVI